MHSLETRFGEADIQYLIEPRLSSINEISFFENAVKWD